MPMDPEIRAVLASAPPSPAAGDGHVHFFASEQAAQAWAGRSEGTYVASIADGFEFGRTDR